MGVVIVSPAREAHGGPSGPTGAPVPDTLALTLEQRDPQGKPQDPQGKATVREAAGRSIRHGPCAARNVGRGFSCESPEVGVAALPSPGGFGGCCPPGSRAEEGFMPQHTCVRRLTSRLIPGQRRAPLLAGLAAAALAVPGLAVPGLAVPG